MQNYLLGILPNLAIFSEAILPWIFACFCKTPLLELSPIQFVISRPRKTRFQIWAFDSKAIRGMQNSNSGRITILFLWIFMNYIELMTYNMPNPKIQILNCLFDILSNYLEKLEAHISKASTCNMAIRVVEFSSGGTKLERLFA